MRCSSIIIGCLLVFSSALYAQTDKAGVYNYKVDLTKVVNDRLYVELSPPFITKDETTFHMPKIVPGTYAIADYGRFVRDLTAVDKKGKQLPVEKVGENTWKITNAKKLAKLSYWVDDTWDTNVTGPQIFWPAGTNIQESNNYVLNTGGVFGYFGEHKETDFRITVIRPKDLYGVTGLIPSETSNPAGRVHMEKGPEMDDTLVDVYAVDDYDQLIDSPVMYSKPDTAVIKIANTEVLVGAYSPNKKISAKEIAASIREVLEAQKDYLGGELPVDKYAFIFYFTDKPVMSYGALEHSYSSFYYMPEATISQMNQQLRDFAAHEFFHIVTPLTVHSEEIENFDFNNPEMSQHLWMYEGVTEYFAGHVQVQYGLISVDEYMQMLRQKMFTAEQFRNDVPFTDISEFTLDQYHDQYYNVYQKGALIGLCLDIELKKRSHGQYDLRDLMLELSKKYGKEKAFKDDELFDVIVQMTYPEIADFFNRYVKGNEELPLEQVFNNVGIEYKKEEHFRDYSLGLSNENVGVTEVEGKSRLQISTSANMNAMAKSLGLREGDVLLSINGEEIPDIGEKFAAFFQRHLSELDSTKALSYIVLRKDANGENKEVRLSAPIIKVDVVQRHSLSPASEPTEEQLFLRDSWLRPAQIQGY